MFDYMSYSQIAALFLGIAFTVISIATTFLAVKYAKKFKSFIKTIFFSLTAPFVASVGWLFLIFSFIQGLRNDDLLNLIISIILALFICAMVITVAKALYNKHADLEEKDEEETAEQEEPAEQAVVEDEELATEETVEEVEEPAEEEPAEETAQEETPDDNDDEDPTEDEEFEKFLEELRKKVEENPDGDDENK